MKKAIIICGLVFSFLLNAFTFQIALADGLHLNPDALSGTGTDYLIKPDSGASAEANVVGFMENFIDVLLYFVAALAVLTLIFEALKLVSGAGNEDKLASAKQAITWVIISLALIMLSYVIVKTVLNSIFTVTTG
jgi:hypothetical protein